MNMLRTAPSQPGPMVRFRFVRLLFIAALLSIGGAAGAPAAAAESPVQASSVDENGTIGSASTALLGAALPAHGIPTAGAVAEVDLRTGRLAATAQTARQRAATLHGSPHVRGGPRNEQQYCDTVARLRRGGISSSSLGTPPPLS
jgi:hypothetical protein